MSKESVPSVAVKVFELLEPLDPDVRQRVVIGALAMLGDTPPGLRAFAGSGPGQDGDTVADFGSKANRWLKRHNLTLEQLEHAFHFGDDGAVEVLEGTVPGDGMKGQSTTAYLLLGVRHLLADDEPKFTDGDAVALCKRLGCHDSSNHAATRRDLGNRVTGSKKDGFTLTTPGLREAAEIVKKMAANS